MNFLRGKIRLYTIGHSTRPISDFLDLLREFNILTLVDIRHYPGSRKFPHFNRQALEHSLPAAGIEYVWLEDLGGRRSAPKTGQSLNPGLKSPGFRNYADYMQTEQFRTAAGRLLLIASAKPAAVMCAEKLFWKCHRRLLSDYLAAHGCLIEHIIESGRLQPHKLSEGAVITDDLNVIYLVADNDTPSLFDH